MSYDVCEALGMVSGTSIMLSYSFFFKDFIYLFLERGEGRERSINVWLPLMHLPPGTWPAKQARALNGN